jgi:hypothetical protein
MHGATIKINVYNILKCSRCRLIKPGGPHAARGSRVVYPCFERFILLLHSEVKHKLLFMLEM